MITEMVHVRETRLVSYDFLPGVTAEPVPMWRMAPGREDMGVQVVPVKTARVSLIRRDGLWHADAMTVIVVGGTPVTVHIELPADDVPFWLVQLAIRAAQEGR